MKTPLNDFETFAAVTAGAGGMSGFAALVTYGYQFSVDFAGLSVLMLAVAGIAYAVNRLAKHIISKNDESERNGSDSE